MIVVFENHELLPVPWRDADAEATARVFNPALLRDATSWLLAYRVVTEPRLARRIALCRLDEQFRVIAGSQLPMSDWFSFPDPTRYAPEASQWFADPRLYRLQGRLFLYWNSGWHEPRNYQFFQELDRATLQPLGTPREIVLSGLRQKLEKNWSFFDQGSVHAVYSVNPHRILAVALDGDGPIRCADATESVENPGGHAQRHGGLRGGAPPQRVGDHYYSFCHSIENGADGYHYLPSVYRFAAEFPFRPTDMPLRPLRLEVGAHTRRRLPKLNPAVAEVIYPAGAAYHNDQWAISFGVDDERCAIAVLPMHEVTGTLGSATARPPTAG